jgi:2-keto-4-pentenoate hydratase/2-oxohepta-3-ene-1,7-dioic acid hydratase in catechol pathway
VKFASFRVGGEASYGLVVDDGIVDWRHMPGWDFSTLQEAIASGRSAELARLAARDADYGLGDVAFDLPVPRPRRIFCVGRNYRAYHEIKQAGRPSEYPSIFARFPESFAPHGQAILKPQAAEKLDYEGELVVVIGAPGRFIPEDRAMDHVFGYTVANEGTLRDWLGRGTQNLLAKNFPRCGGMGPWIATADEVGDPATLTITTRRNGAVVQHSSTGLMIFDIPYVIAHISTVMPLEPGDMILTGSPGGAAADAETPQWLSPGERLEVEIDRVGTLSNPIAADEG